MVYAKAANRTPPAYNLVHGIPIGRLLKRARS